MQAGCPGQIWGDQRPDAPPLTRAPPPAALLCCAPQGAAQVLLASALGIKQTPLFIQCIRPYPGLQSLLGRGFCPSCCECFCAHICCCEQAVNAANAPILPIMLSTMALPEIEAEEKALLSHLDASMAAMSDSELHASLAV